ncbi:MAG: hypothetical protein IPL23_21955 [Saprospiraceae bacterium]|nr:hypothetical protein [Saprospiraceae bacterium]MBK8633416.1 hypothetical protein [Saprospiraceae bacterium]MBP7642087.1 hypothetical protein [Saprospiraceae bacterium]
MNNKVNFFTIFLVAIFYITTCYSKAQAQNILDNGDFESSPPTSFGNNIGFSVTPWILGPGNSSNVVRVDGPLGYNYGAAGPQSDASGITNSPRHYLDITDGSNSFYQSFIPRCSGKVNVGGFFSTRANASGKGSIEVRQGNGLTGTIVGQTIPVTLLGGNSQFDAWTPVSTQVTIQANQPYSFIVSMDNNMNFDEGYAIYDFNCPTQPDPNEVDLCCPPLFADEFKDMFSIQGDFQNHTISFTPTLAWRKKMQAYANWRFATNPCFESLSFILTIRKPKAGTLDVFDLANNTALANLWMYFKPNDPNSNLYDGSGLANGTQQFAGTFPSNQWHRIHPSLGFSPSSCSGATDGVCDPWKKGFNYSLQVVQGKRSTNAKIQGKMSEIFKSQNK